jgi:hypothetical protein
MPPLAIEKLKIIPNRFDSGKAVLFLYDIC